MANQRKQQKELLRKGARERRAQLPVADRQMRSESICHILATQLPTAAQIASYVAIRGEVDLSTLHQLRPDLRFCYPRCGDQPRQMYFHACDLPPSLPGRFGVKEPDASARRVSFEKIDVVLVPGLLFTESGERLGQGGGYYDVLASRLRSDTWRVAVGYRWQYVEQIPTEAHDARLSHRVHEQDFTSIP